MTRAWYLLYWGTSCDGKGEAVYMGRTTIEKEARKHLARCESPYATGYVEIVTDATKTRMTK